MRRPPDRVRLLDELRERNADLPATSRRRARVGT